MCAESLTQLSCLMLGLHHNSEVEALTQMMS